MGEHVPTTEQMIAAVARNYSHEQAVAWLAAHDAEVAAKALEDFAEAWATQDGIESLMFATDDVSAVQLTEKALLARAAGHRKAVG